MTIRLTKHQAETLRALIYERTRGFDFAQYRGEGILDELRDYEELFVILGGEEELHKIVDGQHRDDPPAFGHHRR